jgi:ABC-type sugar transport system ATPase subunit
MPLLELQNVDFQIGKSPVLFDISLQVQQLEKLVILGPSGAGKSSLLRVLAGLANPSAGRVLLGGQPLSRVAPSDRRIALLSQDYALYPQLSVQENLEIGMKSMKLSRLQMRSKIHEISNRFEIAELLSRLPSEISGGQAQRAAFAKAMIKEPRLLLLDEPLSQLDSRLRQQILRTTLELAERFETTVCWVAHDIWEALQIASQVMVIDHGIVLQIAPPEKLYRSPNNALVAEMCSPWGIDWIPLNIAELQELRRLAPEGAGQVGIRPEACRPIGDASTDSLAPSAPTMIAEIEQVQFFGFAHLVTARMGEWFFRFFAPRSQVLKAGQIRITADPSQMLWRPSDQLSPTQQLTPLLSSGGQDIESPPNLNFLSDH